MTDTFMPPRASSKYLQPVLSVCSWNWTSKPAEWCWVPAAKKAGPATPRPGCAGWMWWRCHVPPAPAMSTISPPLVAGTGRAMGSTSAPQAAPSSQSWTKSATPQLWEVPGALPRMLAWRGGRCRPPLSRCRSANCSCMLAILELQPCLSIWACCCTSMQPVQRELVSGPAHAVPFSVETHRSSAHSERGCNLTLAKGSPLVICRGSCQVHAASK